MKNFKLLLATTAILSTWAMTVKADETISTTLNAHVGIMVVDEIIPVQNIDFGTIILNPTELSVTFDETLDPVTGYVRGMDGAKVMGTKAGQVSVLMVDDSPKTIQVSSQIYLYDLEGHYMYFEPSSAEINSQKNGRYIKKTYGIGGRAFIYGGVHVGDYTGELTVTVIADTGE